jgi:hypothetical protein
VTDNNRGDAFTEASDAELLWNEGLTLDTPLERGTFGKLLGQLWDCTR